MKVQTNVKAGIGDITVSQSIKGDTTVYIANSVSIIEGAKVAEK